MNVPLTEIEDRLRRVQTGLAEGGVDAAVIVHNVGLYYLTGTTQQAHLLVPAQGEPLLLVRRDLDRARAESPLPRIEGLASLRALPEAFAGLGVKADARLAFELDVLPVMHWRRYHELFPHSHLVDCGMLMREVRSVKSAWEIERLREAGHQADVALAAAAEALRPGMTEAELAAVVAASLVRQGHPGLLRMRGLNQEMPLVHVFAGPDAGAPSGGDVPFAGRGHTPAVPQGASCRPIGPHEAVVVDLGSSIGGYIVDTTRTFSLGPLPPDLAAAYDACRGIRRALLSTAAAGVSTRELYESAARQAADAGYADHFMGAAPSQVSFVGHGVGLEVDELPVLSRAAGRPLADGNVVAIEPKILLPGRGAVGVEDTCVVGPAGFTPVTETSDALWEV